MGLFIELPTSKEQAEKFIGTALKKAKSQGIISEEQEYGVVSTYRFNPTGNLNLHAFTDADTEWLHCVVAHRKEGAFPEVRQQRHQYDIVAGKIADDAMNFTIAVQNLLDRCELLWSSVFVTLVAKKYRFMQFELDMVFDTH